MTSLVMRVLLLNNKQNSRTFSLLMMHGLALSFLGGSLNQAIRRICHDVGLGQIWWRNSVTMAAVHLIF